MVRLVTFSFLILMGAVARAEHRAGVMSGNNNMMQQQQPMMNQGMGMGMGGSQMPDNSKQKEAAAKSIKDGEEVRNKMQQAVQKGLEGMSKSVSEFSNMISGFNKNSDSESSKELMKTLAAAGKSTSGSDEAMQSAMDMIVSGYKTASAAVVKSAQETGAILSAIKPAEVKRKPTSLEVLQAGVSATGGNALADAMAVSSGKSDLIPKFGNNPIGFGGSRGSGTRTNTSYVSNTPASDSTGSNPEEQTQAHAAQ